MYSLISLVVFIFSISIFSINVILGLWVLFRNPRDRENLAFFIFSLGSASWLLFSALSDFSHEAVWAMFFARWAMAGVPIFIAFVLYFSLIFPRREKKKKISKLKLFLIFFPVAILEIFVPTRFNISSVKIEEWGTSYEAGHLFTAVFVMLLVYLSLIIWIMIKKYRKEKGIAREQILYFLLGVVAVTLIGVTTNMVLPWLGYSEASLFGPGLALLAFYMLLAYSIIRYRLLDVRSVIQIGLVYFFIFSLFALLFLSIIVFFEHYLRELTDMAPMFSAGAACILFALCFPHLKSWFLKITDKVFFRDKYDYADTLHDLGKIMTTSLELNGILESVAEKLFDVLKVDKAVFLLRDESRKWFKPRKIIGFVKKEDFRFSVNDPLFKYFERRKELIIYEELERKVEELESRTKIQIKTIMKGAGKFLRKFGVAVCMPIISNDHLVGVFCLGEKVSKDIFTPEDLNLLNTISYQLSMAIENAMLFQREKRKQEKLERIVDLMVGRELKMLELKKKIRALESRNSTSIKKKL